MNEFMLFIKATGNPVGNLPKEKQDAHVQKVGGYIQNLVSQDKLKDAQPLVASGISISNASGDFVQKAINEEEEMIVGYYNIVAKDLAEATEIAKADPRFEDGPWKMEIRQILKVEGIN